MDDLDQALRQTLRESPVWRLLRTVPGVGEQLSLSSWHTCRSWALWNAGRSPPWWGWLPSTVTATLRGKRSVWGGRSRVRSTLYMGALVASRHNPVIRDFYQRLLAAGKPKKMRSC